MNLINCLYQTCVILPLQRLPKTTSFYNFLPKITKDLQRRSVAVSLAVYLHCDWECGGKADRCRMILVSIYVHLWTLLCTWGQFSDNAPFPLPYLCTMFGTCNRKETEINWIIRKETEGNDRKLKMPFSAAVSLHLIWQLDIVLSANWSWDRVQKWIYPHLSLRNRS